MLMTEKIDLLMEELTINKAELSRRTGIPYMTIVNFYVKGTDNAKRSTLLRLAKCLDVSMDYLTIDECETRASYPVTERADEPAQETPEAPPVNMQKKPCLRSRIRSADLLDRVNISGYVEIPDEVDCDLAIVYRDNSMRKLPIHPGDHVLIRLQDEIRNNTIIAAIIDGVVTLRRAYKNGDQTVLMADDPSIAPLIVRNQNAVIIGKAVAYLENEDKK